MRSRKSKLSVCAFLIAALLLSSACVMSGRSDAPPDGPVEAVATAGADVTAAGQTYPQEMAAFWIDYAEIGGLYSLGETGFYDRLRSSFASLAEKGFDTAIFHVRAFCDAFYPSALFPWSAELTGNGAAPSIDPLGLAVAAAHETGLRLYAWFNPYRVSYDNDPSALPAGSPARRMLDGGEADRLMVVESGIYLDPSYPQNQALIVDGVREILVGYAVDGVHIDDYFYPSDVGDADLPEYQAYQAAGGTLPLGDWRRANVNALVSGIYSAVKTVRPDIPFGISPGGVIQTNYDKYYADVAAWIATPGYCDQIFPQIYFGFLHSTCGFSQTLAQWSALCAGSGVKLYIGLGMYKAGEADRYAGPDDAVNEWVANDDIIARQLREVRNDAVCRGFAVFSYADLTSGSGEAEHLFAAMHEGS